MQILHVAKSNINPSSQAEPKLVDSIFTHKHINTA